jgi:hypothetical protein
LAIPNPFALHSYGTYPRLNSLLDIQLAGMTVVLAAEGWFSADMVCKVPVSSGKRFMIVSQITCHQKIDI